MTRYRGRIPIVDPDNPRPWGRDDITGLPVMHDDMVKQMEFIGTGLAWTGFLVHHSDADQPNPQLMPPRLPIDPVTISNPRFFKLPKLLPPPFIATPNNPDGFRVTGSTIDSVTLAWIVVPLAQAYVIAWESMTQQGIATQIIGNTFTVTGLAASTQYFFVIASTADNSTEKTAEFSTGGFSQAIQTTLPN